MKPFLAKGYAKRKLHTGNQSVQFDEETATRSLITNCKSATPSIWGNPTVICAGSNAGV